MTFWRSRICQSRVEKTRVKDREGWQSDMSNVIREFACFQSCIVQGSTGHRQTIERGIAVSTYTRLGEVAWTFLFGYQIEPPRPCHSRLTHRVISCCVPGQPSMLDSHVFIASRRRTRLNVSLSPSFRANRKKDTDKKPTGSHSVPTAPVRL